MDESWYCLLYEMLADAWLETPIIIAIVAGMIHRQIFEYISPPSTLDNDRELRTSRQNCTCRHAALQQHQRSSRLGWSSSRLDISTGSHCSASRGACITGPRIKTVEISINVSNAIKIHIYDKAKLDYQIAFSSMSHKIGNCMIFYGLDGKRKPLKWRKTMLIVF